VSQHKQLVADPEKNKIMNSFIDKYAELLKGSPQSPTKIYKQGGEYEEDKMSSPEDNYNILRIINANQTKQRQQKEVNCIIEDPSEMIIEECEIEDTCNSELSKMTDGFSRSVIIPVSDPEQFLLGGKVETTGRAKRPGHRRMESRSFDKSSLKKIMEINLEKIGRKGGFKV